ncbi:HU family DNA-binding protein [Aeromonas salmonicida]|uniref:HU family DNA-binding protein n=1 Tax=Aeromonas salmonicida TaxID=645 RepID=UPI001F345F5C|nr:HU family DNA-binding protein [Aeromonas salmonicida]MCE9932707.1 HU family DNA-binding protein [Aeromonas salmonicida]
MNKQELIAATAEASGESQAAVERVLNSLLASIQAAAKKGEEVAIHGFGKFAPVTRAARTGRNPQTGESISIPSRIDLTFKAGKQVKDHLNG